MPAKIEHRITETGEELKRCYRCKQWLPLGQFSQNSYAWDGLAGECRACRNAWAVVYNATHREERRRQQKEHYDANPEKRRRQSREYYAAHADEARVSSRKRLYNISSGQYDLLLVSQGGVCAICGSPPNGMALAVDHNHETGEVRGLLCSNCNVAIGLMKDDPDLLQKAIDYVRMYSGTEVIVE